MEFLTVIFVLAFLSESLTEYIFGQWLSAERIKYVALLVGVALALAYQVDMLHMTLGLVPIHPLVGIVLTGLLLGRGANYVHDFAGKFFSAKTSGA